MAKLAKTVFSQLAALAALHLPQLKAALKLHTLHTPMKGISDKARTPTEVGVVRVGLVQLESQECGALDGEFAFWSPGTEV